MMAKRGPTPSLIGSTHGTVSFCVTGKKSKCRRCEAVMLKGTTCVRVTVPGKMGPGKAYCKNCFAKVLSRTQEKLDALREELHLYRCGSSPDTSHQQ